MRPAGMVDLISTGASGYTGALVVHGATSAAGAATLAGATGCTVPAAGAFTRFPVPDHAADQQSDDRHQGRDQRDIDKVGRKPVQHKITSFTGGAARQEQRESAPAAPPSWDGETNDHFTVSFWDSL